MKDDDDSLPEMSADDEAAADRRDLDAVKPGSPAEADVINGQVGDLRRRVDRIARPIDEDEDQPPPMPPRRRKKKGGRAEGEMVPKRLDRAPRLAGGGKAGFHPGGEKGKLHRELGIPEKERIPKERLNEAARSRDPEIRRDAIRAKTMAKWNKG